MSFPDLLIPIDRCSDFRTTDPVGRPREARRRCSSFGNQIGSDDKENDSVNRSGSVIFLTDRFIESREQNGGAVMRGRTMARTRGVRAGPRAAPLRSPAAVTVPRTRRGHGGGGGGSLIDTIPAATLLYCLWAGLHKKLDKVNI